MIFLNKTLIAILSILLILTLTLGASAEPQTALDAFNALLAEGTQTPIPANTSAERLNDIMEGKYASTPLDLFTASELASDLAGLCGISNGDIAAYSSMHNIKVAQTRNAYYKALANVLAAEIMVNPASEEKYRNVQTILSLFLDPESDSEAETSKAAIRSEMTPEYSHKLAKESSLPTGFVEFIIMDASWNDEDWENDDDWRIAAQWTTQEFDDFDAITIGSRDADGSTRIADMQELLISLGYLKGKADGVFGPRTQSALLEFQLANGLSATGMYTNRDFAKLKSADAVARWEYDEDFWDSRDLDSYDSTNTLDSIDTNETPDTHNSPDTPSSPDTPKVNSGKTSSKHDSPDSPDTPKRNSGKSSTRHDSPDSPDTRDSD